MYPARSRREKLSGGYTLLELLVVLAILGLALAAIPVLNSTLLPSVRFMDAENQLLGDLRTLKSRAKTTGTLQALQLSDNGNEYTLGEDNAPKRLEGYTVKLDGDIAFYPNGAASSGQITLSQGNRESRVWVNGITGVIGLDRDE